ncbi:MAG: acyl-CoA carboxylase subunit beta [Solirubrobacteraceae bacterium]
MSALSGATERALRGGPERHHEKSKEQGKLPVRERVARLLDPGTFAEEALLANWQEEGLGADGVVSGLGRIGGRPVALMANDPTVKAGSWGPKTVEKILRVQERALELRRPMVYLVDSAGARITEQVQMFPGRRGAGRIFHNQVKLSGLVPQVCVLFGPSAAGGAYIPAFCDIVIMRDGNASMYLGSPRMAQMVIGEDVTLEEMGGARMHTGVSGCGHVLVKSDEEGIDAAVRYLSYLPGNFEQAPPSLESGEQASPSHGRGAQPLPPLVSAEQAPPSLDPAGSAANSTSPSSPPNTGGAPAFAASALAPSCDTPIGELIPADENKPFDMKLLLDALVDAGSFMEIHARWAKELIVGFARLEGRAIGIVASQPKVKGGVLFVDSADKAARFIWTCNAFNVPLLFLADVPGFMIGTQVERQGIIRHGAKMISAVSEATVPKISVVVRKAYGAGLYAMAGPAFDPDCCIALPSASIAVMGPQAAINAVYYNQLQAIADEGERAAETERLRAEYAADIDILHLASEMVVDAVIEPGELRGELIARFALAAGRRREWPARHNPITPV